LKWRIILDYIYLESDIFFHGKYFVIFHVVICNYRFKTTIVFLIHDQEKISLFLECLPKSRGKEMGKLLNIMKFLKKNNGLY
jgi:hypothetical protein